MFLGVDLSSLAQFVYHASALGRSTRTCECRRVALRCLQPTLVDQISWSSSSNTTVALLRSR